MNAGHFEQISDCWSSEEQPAAYYRTAAAQARRLQADATTPRVKQYLDKMIAHCERLAGKVEQPASRPLDWRGCVAKLQRLHKRIVPRLPSSSITIPPAFRVAGDVGIGRHWD
jgi:hypothetical protein